MNHSLIKNPHFGKGFEVKGAVPISTNVAAVQKLLTLCPKSDPTPLINVPVLAQQLGLKSLAIKDERPRMGLGSFKALGATYAVAKMAAEKFSNLGGNGFEQIALEDWQFALKGQVFVAASAGNHGLSLAAGARIFGAKAVIYLSKTVPLGFRDKLKSYGAEVVIEGDDYEASLEAAVKAAERNDWFLLSDSTWHNYHGGVDVMEGYLIMMAEAMEQIDECPSHIFLQAGVGGFASPIAVLAREKWGDEPTIVIVEPQEALALQVSIEGGEPKIATGGVSNMGRLDCKEPSHTALQSLSQTANYFMGISDRDAANNIAQLEAFDLTTSPSGGAGFAGLCLAKEHGLCGLDENSRALVFISEGQADD